MISAKKTGFLFINKKNIKDSFLHQVPSSELDEITFAQLLNKIFPSQDFTIYNAFGTKINVSSLLEDIRCYQPFYFELKKKKKISVYDVLDGKYATDVKLTIYVDLKWTAKYLLKMICEKLERDADSFEIIVRKNYGKTNPELTLSELGIKNHIYLKNKKPQYFGRSCQIFIKETVGNKTFTIDIDSTMTLTNLREIIRSRIYFGTDYFIMFDGKIINANNFCEHALLMDDIGLNENSSGYLIKKLKGGGRMFVDVSKNEKAKKLKFRSEAPDWRQATFGFNLEGLCLNKKCAAYNEYVIVGKGYGTFDLIEDAHESKCPMCQKFVKATKCGFTYCMYSYVGVKLVEGLPPQKVTCLHEIKVNEGYLLFDPKEAGECNWLKLKIITKKLKKEQTLNEDSCGVCGKKMKVCDEKNKMKCFHRFHDECQQFMRNLNIGCALCHY